MTPVRIFTMLIEIIGMLKGAFAAIVHIMLLRITDMHVQCLQGIELAITIMTYKLLERIMQPIWNSS